MQLRARYAQLILVMCAGHNLVVAPQPPARDTTDYDSFATAYSRWIGRDFAERALPVIEKLLTSHVAPNAEVLDLCCGAGHIARGLTALGYRVTGVDASPRMLDFSRIAAPAANFVLADARRFSLSHVFAAAVSIFNSLAHVETGELEGIFRNVRKSLCDGGLFLFDLTMEDAYLARWRGSFASVADDHACVVRPTYDAVAKLATNYVTAFECDDRSTWHRSDFVILQRCHPSADVETALARAGFPHVQIVDAQHDLGMSGESGRAFFLCK